MLVICTRWIVPGRNIFVVTREEGEDLLETFTMKTTQRDPGSGPHTQESSAMSATAMEDGLTNSHIVQILANRRTCGLS